MQLTYRGQTYQTSSPAIEAVSTEEVITYRGQQYVRKQYQVEQPALHADELTFLGQRYIRDSSSSPLPCKPRPGERIINGRQLLQMQRSRVVGRRHPAFRGS